MFLDILFYSVYFGKTVVGAIPGTWFLFYLVIINTALVRTELKATVTPLSVILLENNNNNDDDKEEEEEMRVRDET